MLIEEDTVDKNIIKEFEPLDDSWLINFDKIDKIYKDFYKDDLYYINLTFIYLNLESEIEKVKEEPFLMTSPNSILKEEIIEILKKNLVENNKKYSLLSILKYNLTFNPEDINLLLKNSDNKKYLTIRERIDTIKFEKTISLFQDLNDLIFIFHEKSNKSNKLNKLKNKNLQSITRKIIYSLHPERHSKKKR